MGKLSDILRNGDADRLQNAWNTTQAAGEFGLLPADEYVCHVERGELETSRSNGTPRYKLKFVVIDGEHKGRKVWHDCWLTEAAMPHTKRDLGKLGVTSLDQLERPLPPGIRCKVRVVIHKNDKGNEHNDVKSFEVVGIDTPKADPFAPGAASTGGSTT